MTVTVSSVNDASVSESVLACGKEVEEKRQNLLARLLASPPSGLAAAEIESHFRNMPPHYWKWIDEPELVWGMEQAHKLRTKSVNAAMSSSAFVVDWKQEPSEKGVIRVLLCAQDRSGLLAKVAAVLSAVGFNILHADIFTRADHIAFDLFRVSGPANKNVRNSERLEQLGFLLEGALSHPPRFTSFWACKGHRMMDHPAPDVFDLKFDNDSSPEHTVMRIETSDRLGLLSDILEALAESGLTVAQALITTENRVARNQFLLNEVTGGKIVESGRLDRVWARVRAGVMMEETSGVI